MSEVQGGCCPGGVMIIVATVTPVVKTDTVESVPGGYGIGKCGGRNSRRKTKKNIQYPTDEYPITIKGLPIADG